MRRRWLLAGGLALLVLGCRHTLPVPRLSQAPVADGQVEDWHDQPRAWWVDGALGGAAARDGERLGLLLELRDPAWERAFRQGLLELRLGGVDARGRRRVLAVPRSGPPGTPGEPPRQEHGERDPSRGREPGLGMKAPEFRWILRGEDYHDERRLPLAEGGPQVAWGRLPAGQGSFVELVLPLDVADALRDGDHLDLELARTSVPGGGPPRSVADAQAHGRGEGPGGGAGHRRPHGGPPAAGPAGGSRDGGWPGGRGGGAPGRGPADGPGRSTTAGEGFPDGLAGLPLSLRVDLGGWE